MSITNSELGCNFCEYVSKSTSDLKTHDQLVHKLPLVDVKAAYDLSCNLCNYVCHLNIQLKNHIKLKHSSEGQFPCDKCNYVTYSLEDSKHHSITDHNSEVIEPEIDKHDFDTLSKQVQSLEKTVKSMKTDIDKNFSKIESLLGIGMDKIISDSTEKYETLTELINKVKGKVNHVGRKIIATAEIPDHSQTNDKPPTETRVTGSTPTASMSSNLPNSTMSSSPNVKDPPLVSSSNVVFPSTENSSCPTAAINQGESTPFLRQPKVLYVTDKVGSVANMRLVEKYSSSRINTKITSGSDPHRRHVVFSNLDFPGREQYEYVAMSAPSDDISNLKVDNVTRTDLEQQVTDSCRNTLIIAQEAIEKHVKLKKVIIMEHPPRFDEQIRSEMAEFANRTFESLIGNLVPSLQSKIVLGKHTLHCFSVGKTFESRYRNTLFNQIDGLHFMGPLGSRDYSNSLTDIIVNATKHNINGPNTSETCEQPNIELRNRFASLSQGNLI